MLMSKSSMMIPTVALVVVMMIFAVALLGIGTRDAPVQYYSKPEEMEEAVEVVEEVTAEAVEKAVKDLIDVLHETDVARNVGNTELAAELHDKAVELSVWLIQNAPEIDIEHLDQYVLDNY